jgi:hypothetical protein
MRDLDALFAALGRSRFRRRMRLGRSDQEYLRRKGLAAVMEHARRFVGERLAPAEPAGDGRQTPMRGHPVFVAQHATATCCRGCLAKWHGIAQGAPLSEAQIEHVLRAIERWLAPQGVEERPLPLFREEGET